jgi:hypothetical protein
VLCFVRVYSVLLPHGVDSFTSPPKEGILRIFISTDDKRVRLSECSKTKRQKTAETEAGHESVDCIKLAQNRIPGQPLVNVVADCRLPYEQEFSCPPTVNWGTGETH